MSLLFVLILVFAFIVFITFAIFSVISSRKTSVTERLERYTKLSEKAPAALKKVEKEEEEVGLFDNLDKAIEKKSFSQKIASELSKADLPLRVSEFMGFRLLSISFLALIGFLVSRVPGMIILGFIGSMIPPFYVKHLQKKRQKSFNGQIEDALTLISNSLKSGYSFLQAVEMVARETPDPMAIEFKKVLRETSLGLSLEESLNKLGQRMESDDWDLIVTVVVIQGQTGGNLSEILESISSTIRERIKIKGEIMTLTAMGRLSGIIVSALPIGLGALLYLINPTYMKPLVTEPIGQAMLAAGVMTIGMGMFLIKKVITIEV